MPRPFLHSEDAVLDAARDIAVSLGPRAVGVRAVAERSGAPSGSLYHRFGSRDELVARAWLRAARRFQGGYLEALQLRDPRSAVEAAVRSAVAFTRDQREDAVLLLTCSRRTLLDGEPTAATTAAVQEVNAPLLQTVRALAERAFGTSGREAVERATHAVVDLPLAVLRRHLIADEPVDETAARCLAAAAVALITTPLEPAAYR